MRDILRDVGTGTAFGIYFMADPPAADPPPSDPPPADPPPADPPPKDFDWRSEIPEDLRARPVIVNTKDLGSLAKQLVHAESLIGSSVQIPGKDASVEAREAFFRKLVDIPDVVRMPQESGDTDSWDKLYAKLGRPEDASKYTTEKFESEDDKLFAGLKTLAHDIGLSDKQFEKLYGHRVDGLKNQSEQQKAAHDEVMGKIKAEYGEHTESMLKRGKDMLTALGVEGLSDSWLSADPMVLQLMAKIADVVDETALPDITNIAGKTAPHAEDTLRTYKEIMNNQEHAYWDRNHTDHAMQVKRVNKMVQELTAAGVKLN